MQDLDRLPLSAALARRLATLAGRRSLCGPEH
jgi:hypothetical protein